MFNTFSQLRRAWQGKNSTERFSPAISGASSSANGFVVDLLAILQARDAFNLFSSDSLITALYLKAYNLGDILCKADF